MKVFSSGGGVQSSACLVLSAQGKIDYPIHIFANVGAKAENPDTMLYVEEVLKPYAAKHGIEFVEVFKRNRSGDPIDLYDHLQRPLRSVDIPVRMAGNGAPGNRNCTEGWKIKVISKYLKQRFPDSSVLGKGISIDEISRARTNSGFPHYSVAYPLIELGLNRADCQKIVTDAGLPPAPKSSCWFCPFKSLVQWQDLKKEQPELFQKAVELEATLSERRKTLGKDEVYLTSKGATRRATLDEVVSDQIILDLWGDLDMCESGFCMT